MKAYTNATIITGEGTVLTKGTLLVENHKIVAVGEQVEIPSDAQLIDATGKFITPGIIDVHTHLGVHEEGVGPAGADFNETSDPVTPFVRALDGINPVEKGFEDARRSGVTTVQIMPGSANVIGGEMVVLKTVGTIVDEMVIRNPSGMKAALGENPKRVYGSKGKAPVTRMGVAALFRQEFIKAQNYINALEKDKHHARDLGLEQLAKVLKKEIPLRVHAHRADDIVTIIRLKQEFGIDLTIEHCTEGHQISDFLAKQDIRVSVGPTMSTRSKVELADKGWHTVKELVDKGISVSVTTDHPVVGIEYLLTSLANAVKHGVPEEEAWKMVTSNAAKHLGVEDRVGSLEKGKDADFVVWTGHPFALETKVESTFINGEMVYQG